jgi:hypothetical protein
MNFNSLMIRTRLWLGFGILLVMIIVSSVKYLADLMAEITSASQEQSAGIEEVNLAITHIDEMTQQNAALVEQAAAAAESMQEQAHALSQAVAVFRLNPAQHASAKPVQSRLSHKKLS